MPEVKGDKVFVFESAAFFLSVPMTLSFFDAFFSRSHLEWKTQGEFFNSRVALVVVRRLRVSCFILIVLCFCNLLPVPGFPASYSPISNFQRHLEELCAMKS